jgi:hypothetical protein
VMAATGTPENDCESYTNVGLLPTLMTCPLRVPLVQDGRVKAIVYEDDSFPFAISVNDKGEFNNEDKENRTNVVFDPSKKIIATQLIEAGTLVGAAQALEANPNDVVMRLKY